MLYLAMYDPSSQDSAPKVRIRLLGEALARQADVETIAGDGAARASRYLRLLRAARWGGIEAVYIETSTSTGTLIDLAFMAWTRLRGRGVGVYFRDAYQLHRDLYPRMRRRQMLADLAWRLWMPLARSIASVRYAPTASLGEVLGLRDVVSLPPGTDPTLMAVEPSPEPVVTYVGSTAAQVGFELLVGAMALVRQAVPGAVLRAVARPPGHELPDWIEIHPGSRTRALAEIAKARVTVLPLPINRYTDLSLAVKLMDYLSLGKPIVATATRETAAFLGHTGAALLVPDNPTALADAIIRVLTEPGLAERMAEAAATFARRPDVTWDGRARSLLAALLPGTPGAD